MDCTPLCGPPPPGCGWNPWDMANIMGCTKLHGHDYPALGHSTCSLEPPSLSSWLWRGRTAHWGVPRARSCRWLLGDESGLWPTVSREIEIFSPTAPRNWMLLTTRVSIEAGLSLVILQISLQTWQQPCESLSWGLAKPCLSPDPYNCEITTVCCSNPWSLVRCYIVIENKNNLWGNSAKSFLSGDQVASGGIWNWT